MGGHKRIATTSVQAYKHGLGSDGDQLITDTGGIRNHSSGQHGRLSNPADVGGDHKWWHTCDRAEKGVRGALDPGKA